VATVVFVVTNKTVFVRKQKQTETSYLLEQGKENSSVIFARTGKRK
jgi:hypothetical protein